ncbi:dihydrodipicolinate synthase family protein [Lachnoclostridium sp. Marseille-P6806]|uniref:dihydrodipicolinate synthase family protein n=1 Tax=Lachnoclostridium sp. Marseille-P6806 TaxID=2364793 RepID=UPI0010302D30|nr:dihydrodipicolinate synthase family protein [Lachnoclostridium sp. Marseille-P6806]
MSGTSNFAGEVWPVMLTPFTKENSIDEDGLCRLTEWYINNGVNGLFAACQSSEIFYLTFRERLKITEITIKATAGRVPVIASGNTSDSIEDQAKELNAIWGLGADAVILLSNRLAKQSEGSEVWISNLHKLLDKLDPDMKLGIYECPYPYKRVISEEEMKAMVDTERFYFVKDTCCDAATIRRKLSQIKGSMIRLFNANTATLLESLRDGADGYCGVMVNFHPELYEWLCSHIDDPNADTVSDILTMCSFIEGQLYPVNAKWHLSHLRNVPIELVSRTQDCAKMNDTIISEVEQMEDLVRKIRSSLKSGAGLL